MMGAARDTIDMGGAPLPAFPIAYYDDQHLFPSLRPQIEARLPLEAVSIRCPLSPNVPLQCSGLRLELLPHHEPRFEGLLPPASGGSSYSASSLSASSVAMKAAFASIAGVAAHVPIGGGGATTVGVAGPDAASGGASGTGASGATASQRPAHGTHADRPFIYLQILHLEGMEDYKTHHRRMLKAWVDSLTEQHEEWLVLYVTPFTESESQNKSFKKMLDKLRSDLNTQGSRSKERFLRLPTDATGKFANNPAFLDLWNTFMVRLKETLVAAIETRYIQLEDDIQRHSQMSEPRFCPLFVAKENLALLHERCNRLEDALAVYDTMDLGSTTRHSSAVDIKQCHSLFISFGFDTPKDEVPLFFDSGRLRRLQQRVREDTISYVQFRQYLFAKQADLLVRLRRVEEMSARGVEMTSSLHKEIVAEGFAVAGHVWAFLACVNLAHFIVTKCVASPACSSTVSSEGPSRASSHPSASRSPRASTSGSASSALLHLKRPGFAVTRTLHRLTPPQFSLSPTRRQQTQRVSSQEAAGGKAALSSPPSPALAGATTRRSGDGAPGDSGLDAPRGQEAGLGQGSAGTVPASHARSAAHLYAYGAQQLQRLIAWRERAGWSLPLLDFPLAASTEDSLGRGESTGCREVGANCRSRGPFPGDFLEGEARPQEAETGRNKVQRELDTQQEAEDDASSCRDTRPLRLASAVLREGEKTSEEAGDGASQRDGRRFARSASSPCAGVGTPRAPEEDGPGVALASSFSLPWWFCSKSELREELQRRSDAEELLVHVFVLAGQQYVNCGYFRHAALLQFKLASAHFKRRDLEECRKALAKMLPLFVKEPWTALWVQCQQLMAEADRCLGDADSLSSSYFLSNVNAVPHPSFSWRLRHASKSSATSVSGVAVRGPHAPSGEEETPEEGEGDSGVKSQRRLRGVPFSGTETQPLLPPQLYLQRFVSLAQKQTDFQDINIDDGDELERPSFSSHEALGVESRRDGVRPQPYPLGPPTGAGSSSGPNSPSSSLETMKDAKESGTNAGLERRNVSRRLTRSATFMATAWLGPDVPSLLKKEGQIYIRAAPNLYCWGALKPALVGLRSASEREKVCGMRPALSLASIPQAGHLEAFLSSPQGLVVPYGPDDTPCTVPFVTPTAATSTHRAHGLSSGASGGFSAAPNPFAAVLKASLDGRTVGPYNAFHPTPGHLVRGADGEVRGVRAGGESAYSANTPSSALLPYYMNGGRSSGGSGVGSLYGASHSLRPSFFPRQGPDTLSTGVLSGSSVRGGAAGSVASQAGGLLGSVDQELLEQAVLRQLVDLIPLYRLPCHPELEPQNACLLAYATTLERVKPKSTAQLLGQLQQHRLLPVFSPSGGASSAAAGAAAAGGRATRERDGWTEREPGFDGASAPAGGRATGQPDLDRGRGRPAPQADPGERRVPLQPGSEERKSKPLEHEVEGEVGRGPHTGRETEEIERSGQTPAGRNATQSDDSERETGEAARGKHSDVSLLPNGGGATPQTVTAEEGEEESQRCEQGEWGQQMLLSRRRGSLPGPSTSEEGASAGPSRNPGSGAAASVASAQTLPAGAASARAGTARSSQGDATSTGDLSSGASSVRSSVLSEPSSGAVSDRGGASHLSPGVRVPAGREAPSPGASQKDPAPEPERGREETHRVPVSSSSSGDLSVQFRVYGRGPPDSYGRDERSPKVGSAYRSEPGPRAQREAVLAGGSGALETRAQTAPDSAKPSSLRTRPQPLRESEMATSASSAASPHYRSSRALSVLQMGSLQAAVPSLSVSLGQCVELRLHIHSSLVGPVEADAVVLRLSQLPCADFASGAGGSLGKHAPSGPGSVGGSPSAAAGLFGVGASRPHLEETHRQATSVWLVVGASLGAETTACSRDAVAQRPWEAEDQAQRHSRQVGKKAARLKLQPGMNSLSLFWSSRSQGVFVLEQVCVVVGAVVLVQWAGELPAPGMLDEVRQAMQDILLVSLEPGGATGRGRDPSDSDDETGRSAALTRGTRLSSFSSFSGSVASSLAGTKTHRIAPAALSGVKAALLDAAAEGLSGEQVENLKDEGEGSHCHTAQERNPTPVAAESAAVALSGRHRRVSRRFPNPFFAFADWGSAPAALAFEDRMAPQTPACLLPGYTPCGATLIHSDAPLERMLRPLIFEFRPPATAVQLHIQPAGPNASFLFLNAKNYLKIRVDILPGLLVFPRPARLRVLQCLLPAACTASLLAEEDEDLVDDLASETPGALSGMAASGRLGLQNRASDPFGGTLPEGPEAAGTAQDLWAAPAGGASPQRRLSKPQAVGEVDSGGEGEAGSGQGDLKDTASRAVPGRAPSTTAVGSSVSAHIDESASSLRKPDPSSESWRRCGERESARGTAVSFQKGFASSSLSGAGEEGTLQWREGSTIGAGRAGTEGCITPRSMATRSWEGDEQLFEGAAVQLNFCWEEAIATAVDDMPAHIGLHGGQGLDMSGFQGGGKDTRREATALDGQLRGSRSTTRWQGENDPLDASSGADCEGGDGLPVLEQFDFIRIRAAADEGGDVLAIVPRRSPLATAPAALARECAPGDSSSSRLPGEAVFSGEDGSSFEETATSCEPEGSTFSQGWLDLPKFCRNVEVLVPVVPVHATCVRTPDSFGGLVPSFSMARQSEEPADETGRMADASWPGSEDQSAAPREQSVPASRSDLEPSGESTVQDMGAAAPRCVGSCPEARVGSLKSFSSASPCREALPRLPSRGTHTQRSSLFRWRSGSVVSWQDAVGQGGNRQRPDGRRLATSQSSAVRCGSASWDGRDDGGRGEASDARPFPGGFERDGSSLAVAEDAAHVVASLQFYTSTGVDVCDRSLRRVRRRERQRSEQTKRLAGNGEGAETLGSAARTPGDKSGGTDNGSDLRSGDSVPNSLLGYFVPAIYCGGDGDACQLSPCRSDLHASDFPLAASSLGDVSAVAVDGGGSKREGNPRGDESNRYSAADCSARPLSRLGGSISVIERGIEGRRDLAGEGLEEQFDSITCSMSCTRLCRRRREEHRRQSKLNKTAKRAPQADGETPLRSARAASPSSGTAEDDDEAGMYGAVCSPCPLSTEGEGDDDSSLSPSEDEEEPCARQPQPITILRVQTSRVHRLQVRLALTHSCRTLHLSGGNVLHQIFLQGCSPTEPVVLDCASISPVSALQNDSERDKRVGERKTLPEAMQGRRKGPDRVRVSLIVPSPLCPGFSSQLHWQDEGSVQLKTLLFGGQITTLLVRLQHRHADDACASFASRRQHRGEADPSRLGGSQQIRHWRDEERGADAFNEARRSEQRLATLHEQEEHWSGQEPDTSSWKDEPATSLTPRLEPYLLSVYYRFLEPQFPHISSGETPQPASSAAFPACTSTCAGPATKPPALALPPPSLPNAPLEENHSCRSRSEGSQPLVYHIPLLLPVQKFPVDVMVLAPRTGRVSTPLFVSLVFTNCSDIQLQVRHSVSLEFDETYSQRQQPVGDRNNSSLSSAFSSRAGLLADDSHLPASHFGGRSAGANGVAGERGRERSRMLATSNSGLGDGERRRGTAGVSQTGGPGASPRLGECHDWLMAKIYATQGI
ncbi:conserved hypothetical protein [Neospora caninum Liverpool]|uniref:TRAPPC10/Trs130 N-terminal domain-containing protein n=1 Tax=Neospora caninum (strain Liverpool) TaxID=572307 RepID=F0VLK6_NEOCL|nr:conserved hypothetical protein [Neospora caninum Liverpool]CBZ54134.1 conserved hypothetical protein [Neospora caninum Liverpool]|eukprot:XP_003884165.1 conserved hypothetical protein [Neospora caninum Liverpool]